MHYCLYCEPHDMGKCGNFAVINFGWQTFLVFSNVWKKVGWNWYIFKLLQIIVFKKKWCHMLDCLVDVDFYFPPLIWHLYNENENYVFQLKISSSCLEEKTLKGLSSSRKFGYSCEISNIGKSYKKLSINIFETFYCIF